MATRKELVTAEKGASQEPATVLSGEVVEHTGHIRIIKDDLDAITSYDDALAILAAHGVTPVDAAEILADEWVATAKDDLINRPFIVVDVKTSWGDFGPFTTCCIVDRDGKKMRFSDGSTGIYEQLKKLNAQYQITGIGLTCHRGLEKSTYTRRDEEGNPLLNDKGVEEKGSTFYFNTKPVEN